MYFARPEAIDSLAADDGAVVSVGSALDPIPPMAPPSDVAGTGTPKVPRRRGVATLSSPSEFRVIYRRDPEESACSFPTPLRRHLRPSRVPPRFQPLLRSRWASRIDSCSTTLASWRAALQPGWTNPCSWPSA